METVNILCMKWGTKYPSVYVNKLRGMVERNLSLPHRFVCFTDDATGLDPRIETLPLPVIEVPPSHDYSPWRKLGMFSAKLGDLTGKALFLDLDVVITGPLDDFFTHSSKFTIIENWSQAGRGIGNSSVYCFTIGAHKDVLDYYNTHMLEVLNSHDNEQIYLSKKIGDIAFWPKEWCRSFKYHCIPGGPCRYFKSPKLPKESRIIVFHGNPNPPEAVTGGVFGRLTKYTRPAEWIADYWVE